MCQGVLPFVKGGCGVSSCSVLSQGMLPIVKRAATSQGVLRYLTVCQGIFRSDVASEGLS